MKGVNATPAAAPRKEVIPMPCPYTRRYTPVVTPLLVATLAACGGARGPGAGPTPAPTADSISTSPSANPTAEPTPQKPQLPTAAKQPTKAGAESFGEYFWDVANYVYFTGDVGPMRRISSPACAGCSGVITTVSEAYRTGGHFEGARWKFVRSTMEQLAGDDVQFDGRTTASYGRQTLVRGGGKKSTTMVPGRETIRLVLAHDGLGWTITYLEGVS